jgi:hypothetical protein
MTYNVQEYATVMPLEEIERKDKKRKEGAYQMLDVSCKNPGGTIIWSKVIM